MERRERIRRKRAEVAEYYRKTYYGTSASSLMYALANQLNKDSNEMLWWAIVGMTDQFVHENVDVTRYREYVMMYQEQVRSKNLNAPSEIEHVA